MRISQRTTFIRVQDMHTPSLPAVSEKTPLASLSLHKTTENEKRRRFVPHIWRVKRATTFYSCMPCRWYVAFILVQEEISGCNLGWRSEKLRNGNTLAAGAGRAYCSLETMAIDRETVSAMFPSSARVASWLTVVNLCHVRAQIHHKSKIGQLATDNGVKSAIG